tara:strand:+ start:3337 stop:3951 length:615 start_codon:yes stop_codon:yes gene_type:complete
MTYQNSQCCDSSGAKTADMSSLTTNLGFPGYNASLQIWDQTFSNVLAQSGGTFDSTKYVDFSGVTRVWGTDVETFTGAGNMTLFRSPPEAMSPPELASTLPNVLATANDPHASYFSGLVYTVVCTQTAWPGVCTVGALSVSTCNMFYKLNGAKLTPPPGVPQGTLDQTLVSVLQSTGNYVTPCAVDDSTCSYKLRNYMSIKTCD